MQNQILKRTKEAGFTLVELAIVMIIIGLLIGGVLKGQELINNAKVTSTANHVKSIDAAAATFLDIYKALPGDMSNASTRLQNCGTGNNCQNGNGNGVVGALPWGAPTAESRNFFTQMVLADLYGGVTGSATITDVWGEDLPAADLGGGFHVGYRGTGAFPNVSNNFRGGHFLVMREAAANGIDNRVSAVLMRRFDEKLDDGNPTTGSVRAPARRACLDGDAYNSGDAGQCSAIIRLSGI